MTINPGTDNFTRDAMVVATPWDENYFWAEFDFYGEYDVEAGDVVTLSDDTETRTYTVQALSITAVNSAEDTVEGTASSGASVLVYPWDLGQAAQTPIADGNGIWQVDFTGFFDIIAASSGRAELRDANGFVTAADWIAPNPRFSVFPEIERVEATDWPLGATVHMSIDDPAVGETEDYGLNATVVENPWNAETTYALFDFAEPYDVKAGDVVTLSDGTETRTHTVQGLGIASVDVAEDTVSGTAAPGASFEVRPYDNGDAFQTAVADQDGNWQVDLSPFDIVPGSAGVAEILDLNGNGTAVDWNAPNPTIAASLLDNCLIADAWPVGAQLSITVDDPGAPGVEFAGTTNAVHIQGDEDPMHSWTNYCFHGVIRLAPGQTVVVSDGVVTKSHTIVSLTATADAASDTVSGSTAAGMDVFVDSWKEPWPSRHVVADAGGNWTADFSVPGDEDWESAQDLVTGGQGEVRAQDVDGDSTRIDWFITWGSPATNMLTLATTTVSGPPSDSYGLSIDVWRQIAEPLFYTDEEGGLIPAGALSYDVDSAGTTYTVHLRPEAKWSDDQHVTAQHYVDGLSRLKTDVAYIYDLIDTVSAVNDTTLQVTLTQPAAHFPAVLADPYSAPVLGDGSHWSDPGAFVGNGPYRLVEWDDQHAILERNPAFHAASKVSVPRLAFVVVPSGLQPAAYARGDVDVIEASSWAQDDPALSSRIFVGDPLATYYIGLNTLRAPTNNAQVRAALSAAIDRQGLLDVVIGNYWTTEATALNLPGLPGFQSDIGHPYSASAAQAYLAAAGITVPGKVEVELMANDRHQAIMEYVAQQWRDVLGIQVTTVYYSWSEVLDIFADCRDDASACSYNAYRLGWGIDYHDPYSMLYEPFCGEGLPCGYGGWSNADYLDRLDSSEQPSGDRAVRLRYAEQLIVHDDTAVIPLYHMRRASVVRSGYYSYFDAWGPLVSLWGTSNLDGDTLHDLIDPCPDDATNTCNANGSTAGVVTPAAGETLTTADASVMMEVPPSAVEQEVIITITDGGNDVVLTDSGMISAVVSVEVSAAGGSYTFNQPVTITLAWVDADNNGVVDGTVLQEVDLVAYQDGAAVAACAGNPSCDATANTISFDTLHLSTFSLGANQAPTANAGLDQSVDEGLSVVLSAAGSTDPEGDPLSFSWAAVGCSDGLNVTLSAPGKVTQSFVPNDNGICTLRLTVNDNHDNGEASPDEVLVTVANVTPIVGAITAPVNPLEVNTLVTASATFSDPGTADTHTATWDWGDVGSPTVGVVTEASGSGTVQGSHVYAVPNVYTITLTVTDDNGGESTSTFRYVVVYDPSAGFVTGGGWINSPAGAYAPDAELTGRANFGFVARYKKGAQTPSGVTEFQFLVADLNFHSESYDWLVVAEHKAMYKGTGTINGQGEYRFMLSAIDGKLKGDDVDRFRIRIWDDASGRLVYDNQMDAPDDANPTTTIGGGSIVIHTGK